MSHSISINIPSYLTDAESVLQNGSFAVSNNWYHGTSSALVDSITQQGLVRSGDKQMNQAAKSTMATIGNSYTESIEPVFLTQCKELAAYWAHQAVKRRSVRVTGDEEPVVLQVQMHEIQNEKVKPDVGARSLLLLKEGAQYLDFVESLYQRCNLSFQSPDLMNADRMEFLNSLGLAYIDEDISPECINVLTP